MKVFLGITYLMGLIHKNNVKGHWSTEDIISTPIFSKDYFPELIPCNDKQVVGRCQVCNPAER